MKKIGIIALLSMPLLVNAGFMNPPTSMEQIKQMEKLNALRQSKIALESNNIPEAIKYLKQARPYSSQNIGYADSLIFQALRQAEALLNTSLSQG